MDPIERWSWASSSGQSLLETALIIPVLALLLCGAFDLGYAMAVAANLTSASRNGAMYSVQGFVGPSQGKVPVAGPVSKIDSVAGLVMADISTLPDASSTASVQVCSKSVGTTGNVADCQSFGPRSLNYSPNTDPEAPTFMLHRVDVVYTIQPPIPMSFFGYQLIPSFTFHRQASMRAMD